MPWFQIITILIGLAGFFLSKKGGASDTEAALVGAAAGLGTYYVGTETEWGKDLVASLDGDEDLIVAVDDDGNEIKDKDGNTVYVPRGSEVVTNEDGTVKTVDGSPVVRVNDGKGGSIETTVSKLADVLKSWGPTGTAAVIGTTAAVTSDDKSKWLLVGGAILLGVLILK